MTAVDLSARAKNRLDYLDSIRALAALAVAVTHGALRMVEYAQGWKHRILEFIIFGVDPGKIGVVIFFMVSGFLIPHSLKTGRSKKVALRDFLLGRFFRLYPVYWLSMLAAFFVLLHGSLVECPWWKILFNLTMFQGFSPDPSINMIGVYWTLEIEWAFYLVCMGLFAAGWLRKPKRVLWTCLGFLLLSIAMAAIRFKIHKALPIAAPLGLAVMFAANLWRLVIFDRRSEAIQSMRLALGALFASIPIISLLAYNYDAGHQENWFRYTMVYYVAIGGFMLLTTKVRVTWRPLVLLGQASFSYYLFNEIFVTLFEKVMPPELTKSRFPFLLMAIGIVLSGLLSLPLYRFVEQPVIALGKRLTRKLEYPQPAAVDNTGSQYV